MAAGATVAICAVVVAGMAVRSGWIGADVIAVVMLVNDLMHVVRLAGVVIVVLVVVEVGVVVQFDRVRDGYFFLLF